MLEFGVRLPIGGSIPSVEGMRNITLESEKLGYDFVSARDYLSWSAEQQLGHISEGMRDVMNERTYIPVLYEATVVFSYLASLTQKVRFLYSIAQLAFRSPAVLAKQVATLDVLSNGRVTFGIAPGAWPVQYEAFGVPYNKRGKLCDETFFAIRELWTKPSASFSGEFIRFKNIVQYPKPMQKPYPPVIFAGLPKPAIIKRVAQYCDGWFPGNVMAQEISHGLEQIRSKANEYGREKKNFSVYVQIPTCIANTDQEAWNKAKMTVMIDNRNRGKDVDGILDVTLIGCVDRVIKQVEAFKEAGVTHFQLLFVYATIEDLINQMSIMKKEVIQSFNKN